MKRKTFKVRIFQPIVQEYRVALYEGLAEQYGERIEVWASERRGNEVSVLLKNMRYDYGHCMHMLGPFVWQRGFSLKGLDQGDVIVIGGDIHHLSTLWIAVKARLCGIKVIWWGHHKSASAKDLNVMIRLCIAKRLSDVMLCYTDVGVKFLVEHGFDRQKVFATGNTLDIAAVERAKRNWDGIRKFGNKTTLIFCGVLRDKVRLDVLLKALKILSVKRDNFHCIVIGTGEKELEWKDLAKRLEIERMLSWVGEVRCQEELAPWFLSSDVFVYPGCIGLSLIHAFAFGLPVVLNDNKNNHGPEYEAFRPGTNGWAFKENDEADLAQKIETALNDAGLKEKGRSGEEYVFRKYSMARMIGRFSETIESVAML